MPLTPMAVPEVEGLGGKDDKDGGPAAAVVEDVSSPGTGGTFSTSGWVME